MFTNWLTGTSSCSSGNSSARAHGTETPNGLSPLINVNGITSLNTNVISTPPDVALEVGPGPQTIRFMAHSIVLGMHSGYLRSAIRIDERINAADFVVYLSNVTADQFAPLLSYMYTGYLELNVENIFGVLLATHVLHMPRALEICRAYLARGQAEGFFAPHNGAILSNSLSNGNASSCHTTPSSNPNSKIIRPIASKPPLNNFGFLPMSHSVNLPPITDSRTTAVANLNPAKRSPCYKTESIADDEDDIEVDEIDKNSSVGERHQANVIDDEDEDIEVFIDTNSEAEVVVETEIRKLSFKKSLDTNKNATKESDSVKVKHERSHKKSSNRSDKQRRRGATAGTSSSGLQVAKAPIPASQLDTSEANKVIIDVASCDGPVRFKRILNAAYGHKPEACSLVNPTGSGGGVQERSLQSVSLSFHQQMAKTISQQQQVLHNGEESENSETSNGSAGGGGGGGGKSGRKTHNEVFVCVYCKHTFKSQYCYQKHAKRHLNPLTLQATCVPSSSTDKRCNTEDKKPSTTHGENPGTSKSQSIQNARSFYARNSTSQLQPTPNASSATVHNSSDFLRREVRPLDMNVQYYPCKTCGCKFPSYYFVHKHRKMCHAEEEAQQTQQNATTTSPAVAVSTVTAIPNQTHEEEAVNSPKSDD